MPESHLHTSSVSLLLFMDPFLVTSTLYGYNTADLLFFVSHLRGPCYMLAASLGKLILLCLENFLNTFRLPNGIHIYISTRYATNRWKNTVFLFPSKAKPGKYYTAQFCFLSVDVSESDLNNRGSLGCDTVNGGVHVMCGSTRVWEKFQSAENNQVWSLAKRNPTTQHSV